MGGEGILEAGNSAISDNMCVLKLCVGPVFVCMCGHLDIHMNYCLYDIYNFMSACFRILISTSASISRSVQ